MSPHLYTLRGGSVDLVAPSLIGLCGSFEIFALLSSGGVTCNNFSVTFPSKMSHFIIIAGTLQFVRPSFARPTSV